MIAATWPRAERASARLLHIDPTRGAITDRDLRGLPSLLRDGDLLVVNDAATLPASLDGDTSLGPVEVRLAGQGAGSDEWDAILLGPGSWRERTEDRPPPPVLDPGDEIEFTGGFRASIERISAASPRLVTLRFDREGDALWTALYRAGRPVQYAYLRGPLRLWDVQTFYGARPWAVEMPSAGWGLTAPLLREIERRGVRIARLTHAAGLSSAGEPLLDSVLPLPESFDIPRETVALIESARSGGRIVAVGTTVVRALEGCAADNGGRLREGPGRTDLRIGPASPLRVVDGLLTGIHEAGTSHFELLSAFAPVSLLEAALSHAEETGYLGHEFGDVTLVLAA